MLNTPTSPSAHSRKMKCMPELNMRLYKRQKLSHGNDEHSQESLEENHNSRHMQTHSDYAFISNKHNGDSPSYLKQQQQHQQQQQIQRVLNGPPSYGKDYLCTSVALRHLVKAAILVETDGDESGCDDEIIVLVSLQA